MEKASNTAMVSASNTTSSSEPTGIKIHHRLIILLYKLNLNQEKASSVFQKVAEAKVKMTVDEQVDKRLKEKLRDIIKCLKGKNVSLNIADTVNSLVHVIGLYYMCEIFLSGDEEFTNLLSNGSERVPGARHYQSWMYHQELASIYHDFCQLMRG